MRSKRFQKGSPQPTPTKLDRQKVGLRFDRTLLLYPIFVLAALAVLYLVSRSVESELPLSPAVTQSVESDSHQSAQERHVLADESPAIPTEPAVQSREAGQASGAQADRPTAASEVQSVPDIDLLQGTDRTVAMLAMAVQKDDHAGIKDCLDEFVALGDDAVVPLIGLLNTEGQAGLWAAEALAWIGTPMATTALFEALAQTSEGEYKDELGRRAAAIANHDSWPLLLDSLMHTEDGTVARAAMTALAAMADTPVIDEIIARYDAAATDMEIERLTRLVGNIQSPNATSSLLALAGNITSPPQDSLQMAAINALAKVGDAQSVHHLIRRLEASPLGEGTDVYNAITQITNPDAHSHLLHAAAGNKAVSAHSGRIAAIQALGNYPREETIALLERIVAQEANEKVVTAASRTLEDIHQAGHTIVANADSLQRSEDMFPLPPLEK